MRSHVQHRARYQDHVQQQSSNTKQIGKPEQGKQASVTAGCSCRPTIQLQGGIAECSSSRFNKEEEIDQKRL